MVTASMQDNINVNDFPNPAAVSTSKPTEELVVGLC
jgi:hypothetical protein